MFCIGIFVFISDGCAEITPSDVFATMELADRTAGVLLKNKGIDDVTGLKMMENGLKPMHVYQMAVAAINMIIEFEEKEGLRQMPKIVATPRRYEPADVKILADMILAELRKILSDLGVRDYPMEENRFSDKIPTDVFEKVLGLLVKFRTLAGREEITPDAVFPQMVRAVSDVKSVLTHIDPAQRFRIDSPRSSGELTPGHVFKECLLIRHDINKLREHFNLERIPVPEVQSNRELHPADVFIQTQIIIAELNLLKMGTGTVSSTPLAVPVSGKVPADVHQQVGMLRYLLGQVLPLQNMVEELKIED
jgi:hypothetical protein